MPREQPVGDEGYGFHIAFPNTAAGASKARRQFIAFVQHFRLEQHFVRDMEAAVGEALANAAEHGYKVCGTIRVEARLTPDCLEALVSDDGPGFSLRPVSTQRPAVNSPRGYGLFLMQTLVDELEVRDDGRAVWFRKYLQPDEA